jgi:hypothetical protein
MDLFSEGERLSERLRIRNTTAAGKHASVSASTSGLKGIAFSLTWEETAYPDDTEAEQIRSELRRRAELLLHDSQGISKNHKRY